MATPTRNAVSASLHTALRGVGRLSVRASAAVARASTALVDAPWIERGEGRTLRAVTSALPRAGLKVGTVLGEVLALPGRALLGRDMTAPHLGGMRAVAYLGLLGGAAHAALVDLPRVLGIAVGGAAGAALLAALIGTGASLALGLAGLAAVVGLGLMLVLPAAEGVQHLLETQGRRRAATRDEARQPLLADAAGVRSAEATAAHAVR